MNEVEQSPELSCVSTFCFQHTSCSFSRGRRIPQMAYRWTIFAVARSCKHVATGAELRRTPYRRSSHSGDSAKSATGELLLYHRFGRPRGGYGVGVTMHHLPGAILRPEDHRDPQSPRGDLLPCADLGLAPLYLHHVGELGARVFVYDLGA